MADIKKVREAVENRKARSAWQKGVTEYAIELVEQLEELLDGGYLEPEDLDSPERLTKAMLNGAENWVEYSWGDCSLIYNYDIAKRLCCPSKLKKTRDGERKPNNMEEWLDTQARALFQAAEYIKMVIRFFVLLEKNHKQLGQ